MRILILLLWLVFSSTSIGADSLWNLFKKKSKPKVVQKVKHRSHPSNKRKAEKKPKQEPTVPEGFKLVDAQWMANYVELEAAWDYYIPEDAWIWSANGKYLVPIVVFKHYEDMRNTHRSDSATPR